MRTAELLAALSLATDLAMRYPLEHGLHGTLVGMRLCDRLGVDRGTAVDVYFGCLLFYVGCTADAELAAELFPDGLGARLDPVKYGRPPEAVGAIVRSLAGSGPSPARAARVVRRLPRTLAAHPRHLRALCEVGRLLGGRLGVGPEVGPLFSAYGERWDGRASRAGSAATRCPKPCASRRSRGARPTSG